MPPIPPFSSPQAPLLETALKSPLFQMDPVLDPCLWLPESGTTESVVSGQRKQRGKWAGTFVLSHRNIQQIRNSYCLHSSPPNQPTSQLDQQKTPSLQSGSCRSEQTVLRARRPQVPLLPRTEHAGCSPDRPDSLGAFLRSCLETSVLGGLNALRPHLSCGPTGQRKPSWGAREARFEKFCVH